VVVDCISYGVGVMELRLSFLLLTFSFNPFPNLIILCVLASIEISNLLLESNMFTIVIYLRTQWVVCIAVYLTSRAE